MRHRLEPQMMVRQVLIVRMTWMMMTLTLIKRPQSTWQVTGNKRETHIKYESPVYSFCTKGKQIQNNY